MSHECSVVNGDTFGHFCLSNILTLDTFDLDSFFGMHAGTLR